MADSFKSSILLGFQLEDSKSLNTKVENLIKTLDNTKIDLDINIKNSDVVKQLETLTSLANNFKSSLGGNINLGNVNQAINEITNSFTNLNKEVGSMKFDGIQTKLIKEFGQSAGISTAKDFNKNFIQSIKDNWNSGDIEKILSDSMKLSQGIIDKSNKSLSQGLKQELVAQYEGFLDGIKGTKISLRNIEFDKTQLQTLEDNFQRMLTIDNKKGTPIDTLMQEWTEKAQKFGFTLDGVIQDKLLKLSEIVNEYRDVKKNGMTTGLSNEDETATLQQTEKAYLDLIESLEKLDSEKAKYKELSMLKAIQQENEALEKQKQLLIDKEKAEKITSSERDNGSKSYTYSSTDGTGKQNSSSITFDKNGEISAIVNKQTEDLNKEEKAIQKVQEALEKLQTMEANGLIDKNKIGDLSSQFINDEQRIKDTLKLFSGNEINNWLNQVKQLENEEKNLIKIEQERAEQIQKENELNTKLNNAEFLNNQKTAYKSLFDLQNEEYSLKEKLISAEGQYKQQLSERLATVNQLKSAQQQNIQDNNLSHLQREVELENQRIRLNEQLKMSQAKNNDSNISSLTNEINKAIIQVEKMKASFGSKLPNGFIESIINNLNKMLTELKQTDNIDFNNIKNNLKSVKSTMEQTTNSLKETSGFFSNMNNFLGKIGVFYGVQQVVQGISQQFKEAYQYTVEMDKSLTNMQMITGQSKEQIQSLVDSYKQLGDQLHTTNSEMMGGMEEVTRAGITGDEGKSMMESSIIGSKISGQSTEETMQQLIAIKNAFDMTGQSMQGVVDMISKMDNVSATSFKEIASAIQRTAYSSQEAGTPLSNLVAYITTVSEKTRKSAETINKNLWLNGVIHFE